MTSDDYYTPAYIFDALQMQFDLDVCAPENNLHWIPAKTHFNIDQDGLAQAWFGTVWMNPPFSNPTPWVKKFQKHNNGVGLIPTSNGKWLTELWNDEISFVLPTPIKFIRGEKQLPTSIPTRCYLIATKQWAHKLEIFGKVR